jgi:hypothetical protein
VLNLIAGAVANSTFVARIKFVTLAGAHLQCVPLIISVQVKSFA